MSSIKILNNDIQRAPKLVNVSICWNGGHANFMETEASELKIPPDLAQFIFSSGCPFIKQCI